MAAILSRKRWVWISWFSRSTFVFILVCTFIPTREGSRKYRCGDGTNKYSSTNIDMYVDFLTLFWSITYLQCIFIYIYIKLFIYMHIYKSREIMIWTYLASIFSTLLGIGAFIIDTSAFFKDALVAISQGEDYRVCNTPDYCNTNHWLSKLSQ